MHLVNQGLGGLQIEFGKKAGKFVPAQAGHNVRLTNVLFEHLPHGLQNGLSCIVTMLIVDGLEIVQI